jgi:hypothetical protein
MFRGKRNDAFRVWYTIFSWIFRIQEERQKGYFDEAGNYVENPEVDEDGEVDAWLQSDEGRFLVVFFFGIYHVHVCIKVSMMKSVCCPRAICSKSHG